MEDNYLNPLIAKSNNSYELVMALKKLKENGYTYIQASHDKHKLGNLMFDIVSMSKHGYSYKEIVTQLLHY